MISYQEAKDLYLQGVSFSAIQKDYGFNKWRLKPRLEKEGLYIKPVYTQHLYNDSFFDVIDTEEKAYWLGFMYADGYVGIKENNRFEAQLQLAEVDMKHVEKFRDIICPTGNVSRHTRRFPRAEFYCYRFSIVNKRLVQSLIDKGCTPKKSLILSYPFEKVPAILNKHFIRGYFDGDGTLGVYGKRVQFKIASGSISFLDSIQKVLSEEIEGYTVVKLTNIKRGNCWTIDKGGRIGTSKILEYMYLGASIYLDRKFSKYTQIRNLSPSGLEIDQIIKPELSGEAVKP